MVFYSGTESSDEDYTENIKKNDYTCPINDHGNKQTQPYKSLNSSTYVSNETTLDYYYSNRTSHNNSFF